MPYVFDLVGEPLPPYYELLSDVAEQIGALEPRPDRDPGRHRDHRGRPHRRSSSSCCTTTELVQYDFSIGERYAVDEMWYPFD